MYTKETGIADSIMEFIHKIPIVGDLAKIIETIFGVVGKAFGAVANAIMGGGTGAAETEAMAQQLAKDGYGGDLGENAGGAETIIGIRDIARPAGIGQVDTYDLMATTTTTDTPLTGITDDLPGNIDITGGGGGTPTMSLDKRLVSVNPTTKTFGPPFTPMKNEAKLAEYIKYASKHPGASYWFEALPGEQAELKNILTDILGYDPFNGANAGKLNGVTNPELTEGFYKNLNRQQQERFGKIILNNSNPDTMFTFSSSKIDGFKPANYKPSDYYKYNGKRKPLGESFAKDVDNFVVNNPGTQITATTITTSERTTFIDEATKARGELKVRLGEVQNEIKTIGTPKDVAETQRLKILKYQESKMTKQITDVDDIISKVQSAPLVNGEVDVAGISTKIDPAGIGSVNKELDNIDKVLKKISTGSGGGPRVMKFTDSEALQKSITSTNKSIQSQLDEITKIKTDKFGNVVPTDPKLKVEWDDLVKNETALTNAQSQLDEVGKGLGALTPDGAGNVTIDSVLEGKVNNVSTIKTDIATANTALTGISTSTKVTTMTTNQLNDALRNAGKSATSAAAQLKKVNAEIASLEKNKIAIRSIKKKRLDTLYKQRDGLEEAGKKFTKVADDLTNAKAGASGQGAINISDDIVNSMDDATKSVKSLKLPTKLQNFLKGAGKFGIDMIIVAVSNWAGEEYLNRLSIDGQLDNLVYGADGEFPISEFENNTWYKVTVIKQTKKYDVIIEKEVPSISNDVTIHYKENKEIKEIQTSEHQEELLQSYTPQVQSQDWSELAGDKSLDAAQISASLEELQMRIYSQYEDKLKDYAKCTFSSSGTACVDIEPLTPNMCAAFVTRVAKELYGLLRREMRVIQALAQVEIMVPEIPLFGKKDKTV